MSIISKFNVDDVVSRYGKEGIVSEIRVTGGATREEIVYRVADSEEWTLDDALTLVLPARAKKWTGRVITTRLVDGNRWGIVEVDAGIPASVQYPDGLVRFRIDTANNAEIWVKCVELEDRLVNVWSDVVDVKGSTGSSWGGGLVHIRTILKIEESVEQ